MEQEVIELPMLKSVVSESSQEQWKKQGIKMYSRGYFQQAKICFMKAGSKDLEIKSHGHELADKASKKIIRVEADRNNLKNNATMLSRIDKADVKELKRKYKKE